MTDIEFTGERFVPGKSPAKIEAEHLSRYEFASRFLEGKNVIDIGCGAGYGSYMLLGAAQEVTGIDVDEEAVAHAKINYEADNLHFTLADVAAIPFPDNSFDAAVCFEVIEHIENPLDFLKEASRIIRPDGTFIISTPNGAVKISSQPNPFHVKEYTIHEFRTMLREFFPESKWTLQILGQFIRNKKYSALAVMFKNIYLSLKGASGIKPKDDAIPGSGKTIHPGFEYNVDKAELAEFIMAVLGGR